MGERCGPVFFLRVRNPLAQIVLLPANGKGFFAKIEGANVAITDAFQIAIGAPGFATALHTFSVGLGAAVLGNHHAKTRHNRGFFFLGGSRLLDHSVAAIDHGAGKSDR